MEQPVNNQSTLDHMIKTSATNTDRNHFDEMISYMLEKQLIYDKPSKKVTSYYILERMNDDIDNNANNTKEDQNHNRQFT